MHSVFKPSCVRIATTSIPRHVSGWYGQWDMGSNSIVPFAAIFANVPAYPRPKKAKRKKHSLPFQFYQLGLSGSGYVFSFSIYDNLPDIRYGSFNHLLVFFACLTTSHLLA